MKYKALVFGINGQDGYYLSGLLRAEGIEVIGVSRSVGNWILGDIADRSFVETLIKAHQPEYVFHLAANSTTKHYALFENHKTIATGTLNILEAVYKYSSKSKVFLSGSAMQFKNDGLPIDEGTAFEAKSPYAIARIESVYAGRYYRNVLGLKVYVGYFFNHDSPLRSENHVNQKIIRTVQRIINGSTEKLELGNIDVQKEFNFAGDIANAVWQLINQDLIFEAVIGSGETYSIKQWVQYCFEFAKKNWENYTLKNESFTAEYDKLISKPTLIKSIGWEPEINIVQLVEMMMNN